MARRILNRNQRKRYQNLLAIQKDPNQTLTARQQRRLKNLETVKASGAAEGSLAHDINQARPIRKPGDLYDIDVAGEQAESEKQLQFFNPNVQGPTGSTQTTLNPDGTVSVDQSLSEGQQAILSGGEALTQAGQAQASNLMGGYQQFGFDSSDAGRQRIEQDVYGRLTRNLERDRGRELESMEQKLFNKGIPYSDDPNSRFQKEMGTIQTRYDDRSESARSQATILGGDELSRSYGMGLGQHQQGISDIGSLSNVGQGYTPPQFQQYQAPGYDVQDPSSYVYAGKQLKQQNKQFQLAKQQQAQENALAQQQLSLAGGGGGESAPAAPAFP